MQGPNLDSRLIKLTSTVRDLHQELGPDAFELFALGIGLTPF
jgi:hypothetical protein